MLAIAQALDYDLDRHGVSVIDAQNNGNPEAFAVLARALKIPWLAVFDGDSKGRQYIERIQNRGFEEVELQYRCRTLPDGYLEEQLVADGLAPELRETLEAIGVDNAAQMSDSELIDSLKHNKTKYANELAARVRCNSELAKRSPTAFQDAVQQLRGLA